jgi:1,4-dihydroxy-2-naphthoate octaprenyltransferase
MTENVTTEKAKDLPNMKIMGLIKLARPQFLIAYLIVALGALAQGLSQGFSINPFHAIFGILLILISAVGVHYRDEAGDWASGYDSEIGGMGVIRDGIMTEESVRIIGRIISAITIVLGIFQAQLLLVEYNQLSLFIIGVPIFFMIVFVNFLTEEIPLGHEVITTGSYLATFYWVYLAQNWILNPSVIAFSVFVYLVVFALVPYQDIGDIEADKKSGKKTLTAKLGIDGIGHLSIFIGLLSLLFLYLSLLI